MRRWRRRRMREPRRAPEPKSLREHLGEQAVGAIIVQAVVMVVVVGLAISRSGTGTLSPGLLAGIVAAAALSAGFLDRTVGLYEGAHDLLEGKIEGDGPEPSTDDPFERDPLWRNAGRWAGGLALWAGAGALLVAGALRGEHAPFLVAAVVVVVLGGGAAVVAGLAGRVEGLAAARRLTADAPEPVPLHHRAWREIALPMAGVQVAANAGFAYILFHAYDQGDLFAARNPLTESVALADAGIVVALLTVVFGAFATRFGRVDAALGRVVVDEEARAGVTAKAPLGLQGLVYVAFAGLVVFGFSRWVLPDLPSLARVIVVRGAMGGLITYAVAGVAYVRGAVNAVAGASPFPVVRDAASARKPRSRGTRAGGRRLPRPRAVTVVSAFLLALLAATVIRPLAGPSPARADALAGKRLAAEGEAFAVRVEYDVPIPAGTGSIPRVAGRAGPPSGDNAWGFAAAPSALDPVVGGTYYNPFKDEDFLTEGHQGDAGVPDESNLPMVECFHPGQALDLTFLFPTDARTETADAPATGYASARCASGPESEVHARAAEIGGAKTATEAFAPAVVTGPAGADGLFRPVKGVLSSTTSAWAQDVSVFGGAVTVGAVRSTGASSVTGAAGAQQTRAAIELTDVVAGGVRFSVAGDRIVFAGEEHAIDSAPAQQVIQASNAGLAPSGCEITIVGETDRYPQGFLLSRADPRVGVAEDGTFAASMAGGLLVLCDVPAEIAEPTTFNPQRLQVLIGFAYTSAEATTPVGGFSLANLADGFDGDVVIGPALALEADVPDIETEVAGETFAAPPAEPATSGRANEPAEVAVPPQPIAGFIPVPGVFGAWPVLLAALAAWAYLTHLGIARLQRLFADAGVR